MRIENTLLHYPINYPKNMTGTFTHKLIQKKTSIKKDGTAALYIQVFINSERKQLPLKIYVKPCEFDYKNQAVKGSATNAKDYNLIIGQNLAAINEIKISYRLSGRALTMNNFIEDFYNPSSKIDFIKFYESELKNQLDQNIIKHTTWRQQNATLQKLKGFRSSILFCEVTEDLINQFKAHLRTKLKNQPNTVYTALKNVKKYLHIANKKRIVTPISFEDIKVKTIKGNRTFLTSKELNKLFDFYNSDFLCDAYKFVLKKFLFSCFTGLRISDVQKISENNFLENHVIFSSEKTNKLQRIKLNETAKRFVNQNGKTFDDDFTDQTINDYLKEICKICGITKKVSFHVARHTFATQFLIAGGKIEILQKILGHSKIETTMVYVHIVDEIMNDQISNMDSILNRHSVL
ncbi:site-specific integrase [Lacinutrix sp. Hel_I_90]|uniref:site-specific integrase n=1 Tax=Lacinutrix sp. Hel_I_90 TaxID=1249999 RepID=UPI0005CB3B8F|nr:site-specific integrase [Lacinutrix sp. Hel_I_90]